MGTSSFTRGKQIRLLWPNTQWTAYLDSNLTTPPAKHIESETGIVLYFYVHACVGVCRYSRVYVLLFCLCIIWCDLVFDLWKYPCSDFTERASGTFPCLKHQRCSEKTELEFPASKEVSHSSVLPHLVFYCLVSFLWDKSLSSVLTTTPFLINISTLFGI